MFTSGTTGTPKGVLLPHHCIVASVTIVLHVFALNADDRYVAFLPLAHIIEIDAEFSIIAVHARMGYAVPFYLFFSAYYLQTPRTLTDSFVYNCQGDIKETRPTILALVPAVAERLRKGILANIHSRGMFTRVLFHTCLALKNALIGI